MKSSKFVYTDKNDYGLEGFQLAGFPEFDVAKGEGISHDLMEHPKIDYMGANPLCNEIMALGAAIYVRLEYVYKNHYANTPEGLARTIAELVRENSFENEYSSENKNYYYIETCPKKPKHNEDYYGHDVIYEAVGILKEFLKEKAENDEDNEYYYCDTLEHVLDKENDLISWLRLGYNYAKKRYYRYEQYDIAKFYYTIADKFRKLEKVCDIDDEITVTLDFKNSKIHIKINENPY